MVSALTHRRKRLSAQTGVGFCLASPLPLDQEKP
jgi:hypothetical protein